MAEQSNRFVETLKYYGKEAYYFLSSGIFLKNFAGILGTLFIVLFITFRWMKCYTKHGESLQVHDYIGMNIEDAIAKAEARSFNMIVNDSISRPDLSPGEIIDQKPDPLSRVKEDRTIYLQIVKTNPDMKKLPDLVGNYDFNHYSNKLARKGIQSKISKRIYNEKYKENTILYLYYNGNKITEEDINKGIEVPEGSTLEFVVTERGGTVVASPNLVCMSYREAQFLINSSNLSIGSVINDKTVTNKDEAYIWRQIPDYAPNQNIRMGSQYDLYLTQYRPDGCN